MRADKNQLPICGDYPGENHSLKGFELALETTPAIFLQLLQPVKGTNTRNYEKLCLKQLRRISLSLRASGAGWFSRDYKSLAIMAVLPGSSEVCRQRPY